MDYTMFRRRLTQLRYKVLEDLRFVRTAADTAAWSHINPAQVFVDDIQAAINDCPVGGVVVIAKGTYKATSTPSYYTSRGFSGTYYYSHHINKSIHLQGSYEGDESSFLNGTSSSKTVISGDILNTGIYTDYSLSCLVITQSGVEVSGVHFTQCYEPSFSNAYALGGLLVVTTIGTNYSVNSLAVNNCEFSYGYCKAGAAMIFRSTYGTADISNCEVHNCSSVGVSKPPIYFDCSSTITFFYLVCRDWLCGNFSVGWMNNSTAKVTFINSLFHSNGTAASLFGGKTGFFTLINCTISAYNRVIAGNTSTQLCYLVAKNCIIYDAVGINGSYVDTANQWFYNCNLIGSGGSGENWNTALGNDGGGNIESDPLFVDEVGLDFSLSDTSPCIDAGDNQWNTESEDLLGNPRITDGDGDSVDTIDMGCYEFQT